MSAISDAAEGFRKEMTEFLVKLIRIPTYNPPGVNYDKMADFLSEKMANLGYRTQLVEVPRDQVDRLAPHGQGLRRVNVLAGVSNGDGPRLHLNGHVDTVMAGEGWTVDPFTGVVRDGIVIGRGTSDMKAGLVAQIYSVEVLKKLGVELKGTLTHSFTVDEETGGFAGVGYLVENGYVSKKNTDFVIITEPTNAQDIGVGIRGVVWLDLTIYGKKAHSASPFRGVNAFEIGAEVAYNLRKQLGPVLHKRLTEEKIEPEEARRPSITFTSVRVDPQGNVIPDRCVMRIDRRLIHGEDTKRAAREIDLIIKRVMRRHKQAQYELHEAMAVKPFSLPQEMKIIRTLTDSIKTTTHKPPKEFVIAATCDQKFFVNNAGIRQCVLFGPGSRTQPHMVDEYARIDDVVASVKSLALAISDLLEARSR